ncbi:calcium/sodium antiporter [Zwartia sp.]|uniref:calcium/sodium antiporter n=1 Tax=Zwartia sp. TaxID=2978004 RepID=UPI003BB06DDB
MTILMFIIGLIALVIGAELLVRGASRLATTLGVSPLVVGLTVVAFGTSAPELAVSVNAVLSGTTDIAIGNVVGSNIFNVLFILGISALITPLVVHSQIIRQEIPILIGSCLLLFVLASDARIAFIESLLLLVILVAYTVFLIVQSRKETREIKEEYAQENNKTSKWDASIYVQVLLILLGLVLLVQGSEWFVDSAVTFARLMGVSDIVIGLTIVAAGTSMPEVATSVMAAIKGERDIAVGNVVGSNTFNILGCLGVTGLFAPDGLIVPTSLLNFDLWVMLAVSFACIPVFMTGREIARWEGGIFIGYYVAYVAYLILASKEHDSIPVFSTVMMSFVVPITVVTLVVVLIRKPQG